MNRIRAKLHSRSGFSLGEALFAVLILALVSGIMAGGVSSAVRVYNGVVDAANAEVLLSTGAALLREELCTSSDAAADGLTLTYFSGERDTVSVLSVEEGGLVLRDYAGSGSRPLIPEANTGGKLALTWGGVSVGEGTVTITDLAVTKGGKTLSKTDSLVIRMISG